jgi:hypothetical protein
MEPKTRKWLGIGAVVGIALSVVVFVPIIIAVSSSGSDSNSNNDVTTAPPYAPSTTTKKPSPNKLPYDVTKLSEDEKDRINCFLEEESIFETLTKYQCVEVRGCIYKESLYDRVPTCYFDRDNLGYKLSSQQDNEYKLERTGKAKAPYLGEIKNLLMKASYMTKGVTNIKV